MEQLNNESATGFDSSGFDSSAFVSFVVVSSFGLSLCELQEIIAIEKSKRAGIICFMVVVK